MKGKKQCFKLGLGCWIFLKFVSFENFQGRIRKVHTEAETGSDAPTNQGMPASLKAEKGKKQMLPCHPWRDMAVLKPCFGCSDVSWTSAHHSYERIHLSCLKPPQACVHFLLQPLGTNNTVSERGISSHVFFHREKNSFSENPLYTSPQVLWTKFQLQGCWKRSVWHFSVQLLYHVRLFVIPWTAAHQASLSITNSQSLLKLMSIVSDAIQPSHSLSSPSPPAFNLSQNQGLF